MIKDIEYDVELRRILLRTDTGGNLVTIEKAIELRNELNIAIQEALYDRGRNEGVAALLGTKNT